MTPSKRHPISGPWGADDADDVVAVLIEQEGDFRRFLPIDSALADAINAGRVASFNIFMSLAIEWRHFMAPLFDTSRGVGAQVR